MKILLSFIICSQVAATCMKPIPHPTTFDTQYNCLIEGYKQSIVKMKEIGPEDVNKYNMFIKFYCTPENRYI